MRGVGDGVRRRRRPPRSIFKQPHCRLSSILGEEWHARALVAFADKQGRTLNCAFAGLLAKAFSGGTVPDEKLRETAEQVHDIKEASLG